MICSYKTTRMTPFEKRKCSSRCHADMSCVLLPEKRMACLQYMYIHAVRFNEAWLITFLKPLVFFLSSIYKISRLIYSSGRSFYSNSRLNGGFPMILIAFFRLVRLKLNSNFVMFPAWKLVRFNISTCHNYHNYKFLTFKKKTSHLRQMSN